MNLFPIPLKDKVVLITGASSGFGQDAALQFAQEGCKVILAARRIDRLQALADKIQDAGGEVIQYSELAGEGHLISGIVYAKPELHEWIFAQRKGG